MFNKIADFAREIADLSNRPNDIDGLTAQQLKERFDENPEKVREFINTLIDALNSTTDGTSGADNLGSATIAGLTGTTVRTQLIEIKKELDGKAGTTDFLAKDNTDPFTPTGEYNPATKDYVDTTVAGVVMGKIPDDSLTEAKMADEMKKQAGGVYPYNEGATNRTNIGTNTESINKIKAVDKFYDTTGTATALTVDTQNNYAFDDGTVLRINPNVSNTGVVNITVDSESAKHIKKFDIDSDSYIDLEEGDILKNTPISLVWDASLSFFVYAPKGGAGKNYEKLGYNQPFMLPIVEDLELPRNVDIQRIQQSPNDKNLFLIYYYIRSGATSKTAKIGILNMTTKTIEVIPASTSITFPNGNAFIDDDNFIYYDAYNSKLVKVRFSTKSLVWNKNCSRPFQMAVVKNEGVYTSYNSSILIKFDTNGTSSNINGAGVGVDANPHFAVLPNGIMVIQPGHCKLITKNKATATLIAQANGETTRVEPYYDSVSGNVIVFASSYIMVFNDKMVRISYSSFRDNQFTNSSPIKRIGDSLYVISYFDQGYPQNPYTLYKINPTDWKAKVYYNNGLVLNSPFLFKGNDKILVKMGSGTQYHSLSDRINVITEDIKKKSEFIKEITK